MELGRRLLGVLLAPWAAAFPLATTAGAEPPAFREVSEAWGISFRHHHGGSGAFYMPETMGSGVVLFDYDGDGDLDVFFADSGALPGYTGDPGRSVLYRNEGDGRFVDVTERAGIALAAYGMGGAASDVDGDGDLDLYVTAFGRNQLFVNRGNGTFEDRTEAAGVGDPLWSASAAFADVDLDGDLDLYVTNYVDFSFDDNPLCGLPSEGLRSYCHPDVYQGLPDRFYRNGGDGTFADETASAGFGAARGKGLGVIFGHLNDDLWPDLYVANDMTANFLFRNRGDGSFEDVAVLAGVAYSEQGQPEAGMGVEVGDLTGDGLPEILVTHLDQQTNALYSAVSPTVFLDRRHASRLAEASLFEVGFGVALVDYDQDGDLDVALANGHIIQNIDQWGRGTTYRQRNQLFRNDGRGRFEEVSGSGLDEVRSSRGLAAGDLDGDGDLDLVVTNSNDLAEVYENRCGDCGGWLQVDLATPAGDRHGVGARVGLETAGKRQQREVRTATSYLSQGALTAHFGVGAAERVETLEVHWPGGRIQHLHSVPISRRLRIHQGNRPAEVAQP